MAFFAFIGDHKGDGPSSTQLFGYTFNRHSGTEVTDDAHIKKLRGNPHFAEVTGTSIDGAHRHSVSAPIGDDERSRMNAAFDRLNEAKNAAEAAAAEAIAERDAAVAGKEAAERAAFEAIEANDAAQKRVEVAEAELAALKGPQSA